MDLDQPFWLTRYACLILKNVESSSQQITAVQQDPVVTLITEHLWPFIYSIVYENRGISLQSEDFAFSGVKL